MSLKYFIEPYKKKHIYMYFLFHFMPIDTFKNFVESNIVLYCYTNIIQNNHPSWTSIALSLGVLTHSAGTRPARLTCEGENMCSCCRQEMALDWTRESALACITLHPTIQLERRAETAALSSGKTHTNTSLLHLQLIKLITPKPLLVTQTHQSWNTLQVGA